MDCDDVKKYVASRFVLPCTMYALHYSNNNAKLNLMRETNKIANCQHLDYVAGLDSVDQMLSQQMVLDKVP